MKRLASILTIACIVCCLSAGVLAQEKKAAKGDKGFKPLFNGKDLSGWSGDPSLWKVENGEIAGSTEGVPPIEQNTFLSTEKSYGDFVLRAKWKLRNHNSGIQFRSEQRPDYVVAGYQADMATAKYCGMLYEEKLRGILPYFKALSPEEQEANHNAAKQGDWNEYVITCRGDHVKIELNGKVTCDINDPDGAKSGIIALQLHRGEPMEVRFKDMEIKELKPRAPKAQK